MRDAYFAAPTELGREDERVWALTGDLGIGLFDPFQQAAPGRYLNVGIAEQNPVGVAAGLSYARQGAVRLLDRAVHHLPPARPGAGGRRAGPRPTSSWSA